MTKQLRDRIVVFCTLVLLPCGAALAADAKAPQPESFFLEDGQRVLFLGDSITAGGTYIAYLDAFLATRWPAQRFTLINLGLSSETTCGLTESDHPGARPNVHDRLDRALAEARPDVVVVCYGMNDGIYHPFSAERFDAYCRGINRLVEKAEAAGAKVVLQTPPPFDAASYNGAMQGAEGHDFGYKAPYRDYDQVLGRYGQWILQQEPRVSGVVDLHEPINRHLLAYRKIDPAYRSGDGVHPNPFGHWLMTEQLLAAWHAPCEVDVAQIDSRAGEAARGDVRGLKCGVDEIAFRWLTRLPMPRDDRWNTEQVRLQRFAERFNRHRLVVTHLAHGQYALYEGDTLLGKVSDEQLAAGVNLLDFEALSTNRRAGELLHLVFRRHGLLSLSWREHVGHKRGGQPRALPLDEAPKQATGITEEIRRLAQPVELSLRIERVR